MNRYNCTDGMADVTITAESPWDAAQEYVDEGEWGELTKTAWFSILVTPIDDEGNEIGDGEWISTNLEPIEPACADGCRHEWRSPYSVLVGLRENPGVQGHGGGVIITEVCRHCGQYRTTDTWAQDRNTGEQGLTSVSYGDADEASLAWVERHKAAVTLGTIGGKSTSDAKRAAARVNAKKKAIGNVVIDT